MAAKRLNPELRAAWFLPKTLPLGDRVVRLARRVTPHKVSGSDRVQVETVSIDHPGRPLTVHVFSPVGEGRARAALLWTHGGGYVIGSPAQDQGRLRYLVEELQMVVVAPVYRLAPEHPHPAALDDAHRTLAWMHRNAATLRIDPTRVAVGGASAGAGLAAALAIRVRGDAKAPLAFQLLTYPMLDDRTVLRRDVDTRGMRLWTPSNNRYAWGAYLGADPGGAGVPSAAVPARCRDLAGLPPAWLGVGTVDLFYDEDLRFVERLRAAGVPVDLHVVPGAFHGFDTLFPKSKVAEELRDSQVTALRRALS